MEFPLNSAAPDAKTPETENPYADTAAISQRINRVLETDRWSHSLFESGWFRNLLLIAGAQWIIKDRNGRWQRKSVPFIGFPRTYTNKIAEKFNELVSQLVNGQDLPISAQPADPDVPADVATAEVAGRVLDLAHAEAMTDEQRLEVASWLVATGNAFGIPHYDMSPDFGVLTVPHMMCPECETTFTPEEVEGMEAAPGPVPETPETPPINTNKLCPVCNLPLVPATDDMTGEPLVEEYPRGALQLDIAGPFEIRLDHRITDIRKIHRFVRQRRYDLDWAKERWGGKEGPDGKVIDPASIKPDAGSDDPGQYYLDVLSNVTSAYRFGAGLFNNSANASTKTPKVTAYEFYELPSEDFPEGIRSVRLGSGADTVVEAGPLPTVYGAGVKKGQRFLGLVHWIYAKVPGRLWGKTPIDDAVPLQITRNVVEANINITVQRMGNPVWFNPKGSGVEIITGESGQVIQYNPVSVGGTQFAKPERVPAELNNLGPLIGWIRVIDDAIERVTGTFFLQGGNAPPGVTAASALAYLGEKGQQSLSTLRANWAKAWRQVDLFFLEIARQNWDDKRIAVVAGRNKQWEAETFTKADLQGAINIIIDYNGLAPKSQATEQARIGQLTQLGMINPADEEVKLEVLKRFGAVDLIGSRSLDLQFANRTQDRFLKDPEFVPAVRPQIDNSAVLMIESVNFAKTQEFEALAPERQQQWIDYCDQLAIAVAQRRQAIMAAGLDPDAPALGDVPGGEAEAALAVTASAQPGAPNGGPGPQPAPAPNNAGFNPQAQPGQQPDIADQGLPPDLQPVNGHITPEGSPRAIPVIGS